MSWIELDLKGFSPRLRKGQRIKLVRSAAGVPMNRLHELYAEQRRADELREAQREANKNALLELQSNKTKTPPRRLAVPNNVRQAVGGKLIEWGKRLQDPPQISSAPSTNR